MYLVSSDPDAIGMEDAARTVFGDVDLDVFFEHGQWWCRVMDDTAPDDEQDQTWSIVDCPTGVATVIGSDGEPHRIDFEVV